MVIEQVLRPWSFSGGPVVKNLCSSAGVTGDKASVPWWGRFLRVGSVNPLQYSCMENPMDRGAWWAMVRRITKRQT